MASDRELIYEVLVHYCFLVDTDRAVEVADQIFAEDAIDEHGFGMVQGRAAIREMFAGASATLERTVHAISNFVCRIDGDEAITRCYMTAWHWSQADAAKGKLREADFVSTGAVVDKLRKIDGRWWVQHRKNHLLGPCGLAIGRVTPALAGMMEELGQAGPPVDLVASHGWP